MSEIAQHDEAIALLREQALSGRAGAAHVYERALRRRERDAVQAKGKAAREEKKRRTQTSHHNLTAPVADEWGPALSKPEWERHNLAGACLCTGCQAYARDLLQSILND